MKLIKCDKCGVISEQSDPPTWVTLQYQIQFGQDVSYHLCPTCREALGIPETDYKKHVGDELLDLLNEIVQETVQQ